MAVVIEFHEVLKRFYESCDDYNYVFDGRYIAWILSV